jgi:hypothetical protein
MSNNNGGQNIMKKIAINILILFLYTSFVCADNKEDCKTIFEEMYQYTKKVTISDMDLSKCRDMVKQLKACSYYEHMIVKDDGSSEWYELSSLYAVICEKTRPEIGIPAFIEHLIESSNSASESLSTDFEHLFRLHPEMVLDEIEKKDKFTKDYLLQKIYWGFLNNDFSEKEKTINGKIEIKIYPLDAENYKEVFFKVYPSLKDKYEKYKTSMDYLFESCRSYFKWLEEEDKK